MYHGIISVPFFTTFIESIVFIDNFVIKFTNTAAERMIDLNDV